ncbi:MAG: sodium:proton antiporter [Hyphomicrobiales bacterium]|nr:sodium:proton antiporter [Hyphomicrobiales bacterium]
MSQRSCRSWGFVRPLTVITGVIATLLADPALAAGLDGATLRWPWALPFIGILATIATGPLLFPRIWHHHYGKLSFMWGTLTLAPMAALYGTPTAIAALVHTLLAEYLSFIVLLFALYVVAGGILVTGNLRGTPLVNTAILAFGTMIASIVGTTGAAMILVRPLIRANAARLDNAHVLVFFIFLVANIGGALSPFGDPPLFIGFLHGVDFFWTATHLLLPTALIAALVLTAFVVVDCWYYYRKDRLITTVGETRLPLALRVSGSINLLLLAGIMGVILLAAKWQPGVTFDVYGTTRDLQTLVRDSALVLIALLSLALTPNEHREANGFTWEPIVEVAILFAGIFACIIPVVTMLQAGKDGAFAWLLAAVTARDGTPHEVAYFWLTGALSAFLDNAPTYLVFFELAGGDANELMGVLAPTLMAISMGAVYMGAMSYIGNAPNLMVYAIAVERGIKMPSFFGYMLWSAAVLLPALAVVTVVFVGPLW